MTNVTSKVVGLKAELAISNATAIGARAVPLCAIAADREADNQWKSLCSRHRRELICLLTEVLSKPYECFIERAGHCEVARLGTRDYVLTQTNGIWVTFLGNRKQQVWLVVRISECLPECDPDGDGPVAVSHVGVARENVFAECYGGLLYWDGSGGEVVDALIIAFAEESAHSKKARAIGAMRSAAPGGYAARSSTPLRFRLCIVGLGEQCADWTSYANPMVHSKIGRQPDPVAPGRSGRWFD